MLGLKSNSNRLIVVELQLKKYVPHRLAEILDIRGTQEDIDLLSPSLTSMIHTNWTAEAVRT